MQKKWKVLLAVCSLAGFIGFVGLLQHFYHLFKGPAFEQSVVMLQEHEEINQAFGSPIEASFFVTGSFFFDTLFLQYDVHGPLDSGTAYAFVRKTDDEHWEVESLVVQRSSSDEMIMVTEADEDTTYESSGSCNAPEDYDQQN